VNRLGAITEIGRDKIESRNRYTIERRQSSKEYLVINGIKGS